MREVLFFAGLITRRLDTGRGLRGLSRPFYSICRREWLSGHFVQSHNTCSILLLEKFVHAARASDQVYALKLLSLHQLDSLSSEPSQTMRSSSLRDIELQNDQ